MKYLKSIKDTNIAIMLVYFLALVLALLIQVLTLLIIDIDSLSAAQRITYQGFMNFFAYAIPTVALIHFFKIFLFKNQWVYFATNLRFAIYLIMLAIYLMFAALMLANGFFLITGIDPISPNQSSLESLMNSGLWYNTFSLFIVAVILAPIVEEMVFRKAIYGLIRQYAHPAFAVIGSAFLFAFIHIAIDLQNAIYIVPYLGLGLVLSFIYYYSGRLIFVPIFAHALMNLYTFILLYTTL